MPYPAAQSSLRSTIWQGWPAWILDTGRLQATCVPELGGRIVSLFDCLKSEEWLLQPAVRITTAPQYGQRFRDYPLFGWDEMFPNLSPCRYPLMGSFYQVALPDHGEAWSQSWRVCSATAHGLTMEVESQALPFRLMRRLEWGGTLSSIRLEYRLTSLSAEPLAGLWAAHPQFMIYNGDQIQLPPYVTRLINARSVNAFGPLGKPHDWPALHLSDGRQQRLDRYPGIPVGSCAKFYVAPDQPIDHVSLGRSQNDTHLRLSWTVSAAPYLGLWFDDRCYSHHPVVSFEPANAYFDNLETAHRLNRLPVLAPGASQSWSLEISINP